METPEKNEKKRRDWLVKMAEAEDACGGNVSVGGLAIDVGFSVDDAPCGVCPCGTPMDEKGCPNGH